MTVGLGEGVSLRVGPLARPVHTRLLTPHRRSFESRGMRQRGEPGLREEVRARWLAAGRAEAFAAGAVGTTVALRSLVAPVGPWALSDTVPAGRVTGPWAKRWRREIECRSRALRTSFRRLFGQFSNSEKNSLQRTG